MQAAQCLCEKQKKVQNTVIQETFSQMVAFLPKFSLLYILLFWLCLVALLCCHVNLQLSPLRHFLRWYLTCICVMSTHISRCRHTFQRKKTHARTGEAINVCARQFASKTFPEESPAAHRSVSADVGNTVSLRQRHMSKPVCYLPRIIYSRFLLPWDRLNPEN